MANEAFVGDVDDPSVGHCDEGPPRLLEETDDLPHLIFRSPRHRGNLGQRGRVTALATIVTELGQALEDFSAILLPRSS